MPRGRCRFQPASSSIRRASFGRPRATPTTPPDPSRRTHSRRYGRSPGRAEVLHSTGGRSMADDFEYISRARLEYRDGYRRAYLGEVPEPVVYGVQGALRQYYGGKGGPPIASTLDHLVSAVPRGVYRPL